MTVSVDRPLSLSFQAKDVISRLWPHCDVAHQMQRLKNSLKDEKVYLAFSLYFLTSLSFVT